MSIIDDVDTYILKNTRGINYPDVRLAPKQYKALHEALGDVPNGWGPIRKVDTRPDLVGFKTIMYKGCQIILDPLAVNIEENQVADVSKIMPKRDDDLLHKTANDYLDKKIARYRRTCRYKK